MRIVKGSIFNTAHEKRCMAITEPDADGEFLGFDADDVEVAFSVDQVVLVLRDGDAGVTS